jgi:hypothetical protein
MIWDLFLHPVCGIRCVGIDVIVFVVTASIAEGFLIGSGSHMYERAEEEEATTKSQ